MTGEETAKLCAKYADDKKAQDIVILDVRGLSPITDYFVVCTASSTPHLRAVQSEIDDMMIVEHDQRPRWRETNPESQWLLLDYSDVMVHIFTQEKRDFIPWKSCGATRSAWTGDSVKFRGSWFPAGTFIFFPAEPRD